MPAGGGRRRRLRSSADASPAISLLDLPSDAVECVVLQAAGLPASAAPPTADLAAVAAAAAGTSQDWVWRVDDSSLEDAAAGSGANWRHIPPGIDTELGVVTCYSRLDDHAADMQTLRTLRLVCSMVCAIIDRSVFSLTPSLMQECAATPPPTAAAAAAAAAGGGAAHPTSSSRSRQRQPRARQKAGAAQQQQQQVQQQAGAHRLLRRFTSVRALQINVAGPKGDALLAAAAAHMGPSLRHLWAPLLAASPGSLSRLVNLRGLTLNLGWYTGSSRQLAAALAPLTQLEVVMLDGMPAQARQLEAALGQLPQLRCLALSHSARQRASSAAAAWAACSGLTTLSVSHGALRSLASLSGLRGLRELYLAHSHVELDCEPPAGWYPSPSSSDSSSDDDSSVPGKSAFFATGSSSSSSGADNVGGISTTSRALSTVSSSSSSSSSSRARAGPLDSLQVLQCLCVGPMVNLDLALARLTALTSLILVDCGLAELPEQVTGCQLLEELDLRGNALMSFPSPVTRLTRLRLLDLTSAGAIAFLPEGLGELTALTELALGDVGLQELPTCLTLLTNLASLCVDYNGIASPWPPGLTALAGLTHLSLMESTQDWGLLHAAVVQGLSGLRKLIAGHNMIACVAAGWAQLTALTHLDFHYCHIMAIDPALGALTALEVLNLSGNLLKLLPATFSRLVSLRMLLVAGNQLTDLPPGLTALRALQEVDVMGNPFQALPASLVTLGESEGTALARVWLGVGDKHLVAEGAQSVGHAAIAWRG